MSKKSMKNDASLSEQVGQAKLDELLGVEKPEKPVSTHLYDGLTGGGYDDEDMGEPVYRRRHVEESYYMRRPVAPRVPVNSRYAIKLKPRVEVEGGEEVACIGQLDVDVMGDDAAYAAAKVLRDQYGLTIGMGEINALGEALRPLILSLFKYRTLDDRKLPLKVKA